MIRLTRLNRAPMVLNSDLIEHIDVTPDTVITLTTGQILRVRETAEEVIDRIVDFRHRIFAGEGRRSGREPKPWDHDSSEGHCEAKGEMEDDLAGGEKTTGRTESFERFA